MVRLGDFTIQGVKNIETFSDSLLVAHQFSNDFQRFEGLLNAYLDKCLDVITYFDEFCIYHFPRHENYKANILAQQASGYNVEKSNFYIKEALMQNIKDIQMVHKLAKMVSETGLAFFPYALLAEAAKAAD